MKKRIEESRDVYMVRFKNGGWVHGYGDYTGPLEFDSDWDAKSFMRGDPREWRVVPVRVTIEEIKEPGDA